jgi:hypothetical protein
MSVGRVLGNNKIRCDCQQCRLQVKHRPTIVKRHWALYKRMERPDGKNKWIDLCSENTLLENPLLGTLRRRSAHSALGS